MEYSGLALTLWNSHLPGWLFKNTSKPFVEVQTCLINLQSSDSLISEERETHLTAEIYSCISAKIETPTPSRQKGHPLLGDVIAQSFPESVLSKW